MAIMSLWLRGDDDFLALGWGKGWVLEGIYRGPFFCFFFSWGNGSYWREAHVYTDIVKSERPTGMIRLIKKCRVDWVLKVADFDAMGSKEGEQVI